MDCSLERFMDSSADSQSVNVVEAMFQLEVVGVEVQPNHSQVKTIPNTFQ